MLPGRCSTSRPVKGPSPRSCASSSAPTRSPISASPSVLAGYVAAQPFLTGGRPDLRYLVKRLEGGRIRRQFEPRQLASGEDVDVGLDLFRMIQGPDPNE